MKAQNIYVIIGHRGTGKTSWVRTIKKHFEENQVPLLAFDVDQQIEEQTQQKILKLFEKGESLFRKIEEKIFNQCLQQSKKFKGTVWISLGAGYCGDIPPSCTVIHLKRPSDSKGRIFFDRPRLLTNKSSFEEYQELYPKREDVYRKQRDLIWTRLDGFLNFNQADLVFLGEKKLPFNNGVLTLKEEDFLNEIQLENFLNHKLQMGFRFFELKNNETSIPFIEKVLKQIPLKNILFSFRKKEDSSFQSYLKNLTSSLSKDIAVDWPLEWGLKPFWFNNISHSIYSLHDRKNKDSMESLFVQFPQEKNVHFKLAVEVFSLEELWKGYIWQQEDPQYRSFHPRSSDGRWKWYRILFGFQQFIYFIREDIHQGVLDQPLIAEACQFHKAQSKGFACVLGNPIEHSITPSEHYLFFKQYNLLILKILMKEEEVHLTHLKILEDLGMKFAAITSPLKKNFYQLIKEEEIKNKDQSQEINLDHSTDLSLSYLGSYLDWKSLNTIILKNGKWKGFNTDIYGALFLRIWVENMMRHKKINQKDLSVAIWGGGGILNVLESAFTDIKLLKSIVDSKENNFQQFTFNLSFYSARTGKLKKGSLCTPDIIVWAAGRGPISHFIYPPQAWKPFYILDLNYTEDSPGREYAIRTQAEYIAGHIWFKAQAKWQRNLFKYFNYS